VPDKSDFVDATASHDYLAYMTGRNGLKIKAC